MIDAEGQRSTIEGTAQSSDQSGEDSFPYGRSNAL